MKRAFSQWIGSDAGSGDPEVDVPLHLRGASWTPTHSSSLTLWIFLLSLDDFIVRSVDNRILVGKPLAWRQKHSSLRSYPEGPSHSPVKLRRPIRA